MMLEDTERDLRLAMGLENDSTSDDLIISTILPIALMEPVGKTIVKDGMGLMH